jgi:hypothetical protein
MAVEQNATAIGYWRTRSRRQRRPGKESGLDCVAGAAFPSTALEASALRMKADFPYANFDAVPEEIRRELFIFPRANHANSFTPPATVWLLKRFAGLSWGSCLCTCSWVDVCDQQEAMTSTSRSTRTI